MMSEVGEGMTAPDFDLPRDGGRNVSLAGLAGKIVVLYFYPKDRHQRLHGRGRQFYRSLG